MDTTARSLNWPPSAAHRDCRLRKGRADAGGAMRMIIAAAVVSLAVVTATCCSSRAEPAATELTDADAARIVGDLLNQQSNETLLLGNIAVYTTAAPIPWALSGFTSCVGRVASRRCRGRWKGVLLRRDKRISSRICRRTICLWNHSLSRSKL